MFDSGKWTDRGPLILVVLVVVTAALAAMLAFRSKVPTVDALVHKRSVCTTGNVELALGGVSRDGVLQIFVLDGKERTQHVIALANGPCIARSELDRLAAASGLPPSLPVNLFIGHDPRGTPGAFRDRLEYDLDAFKPNGPDRPVPPDLHFGEARWSGSNKSPSVEVFWYKDYGAWRMQKYLESSRAAGIMDY